MVSNTTVMLMRIFTNKPIYVWIRLTTIINPKKDRVFVKSQTVDFPLKRLKFRFENDFNRGILTALPPHRCHLMFAVFRMYNADINSNDHHTIMENCHWRAEWLIQLLKIDFKWFWSIEDETLNWMHQFDLVIRYSILNWAIKLRWIASNWIGSHGTASECAFTNFIKRKKINIIQKVHLKWIGIHFHYPLSFVSFYITMKLKFANRILKHSLISNEKKTIQWFKAYLTT